MPLVTVHTYKNSAILVSIVINGSSMVGGFYSDYTVTGVFSNGTTSDLTSSSTWSVLSGNTYGSVNNSGQVTNTNTTNFPQYLTIQAQCTHNNVVITSSRLILISTSPDVYYSNTSLILSGDTSLSIVSTEITGVDSVAAGGTVYYTVTGTFSDSSVFNVDNFTSWIIVSGEEYGTINSSTGALSIDSEMIGIHTITIRALTYYNGTAIENDKTITAIASNLDFYFTSTSVLLSGDFSLNIVGSSIDGPNTLVASGTSGYNVLGTFSDGTTMNVNSATTWEIISGGEYGSINPTTGIVTVNNNITTASNIIIRSTTTFNDTSVQTTKTIVTHGALYDPYFENNSILLKGDVILSLISVAINGSDSFEVDQVHDFSVTGTFSDSSTSSVDNITSWSIVSGSEHGSINTSTGVLTVGSSVVGLQTITIRSATTYNDVTVYSNKTVNVYGMGTDVHFPNTSLMLAGDSNIDLVSVEIRGGISVSASDTYGYTVYGTLSDNTVINVDGRATWSVVAGGSYGSINSSTGVFTADSGVTNTQSVTIRATVVFGDTTVTDDHIVYVHAVDVDPFFTDVSTTLSGDIFVSLNSVLIDGVDNIVTGNSSDYSATGTLSTGGSVNVDAYTTWEITDGGSYGSINSSNGTFTSNNNLTGISSVTIRSTTTLYGDTVYATKTISIYGVDVDQQYTNVSVLLSGDFNKVLTSTLISGADAVQASGSYDYSVSGYFNDNTNSSVDSITTWSIIVGGAYASINSTTGVLTANGGIAGSQLVTIRATTVYEQTTVTKDKDVYVHNANSDPYFGTISMLLAG